jgi:hypothetical protein
VCTALTADKPDIERAYPKGAQGCVATINTDRSHVYDSGQFIRSTCTLPSGPTNQQLVETSDPTTHAVRIVGTGTVSYASSAQDVGILSGYLNSRSR